MPARDLHSVPLKLPATAAIRLVACACAALAAFVGPVFAADADPAESTPQISLTIRDVVVLALRNSRALDSARVNRSVERFALRIAEDEFRPRITLDAFSDRDVVEAVDETSGIGSAIRLRVPTGGEFAVSTRVADLGLAGVGQSASDGSAVDVTFVQPLLRGAGFGVARAALRTARVREEINALSFEATVIELTTRAVRAYRAYVQAGQRDEIAARSLQRARELLEVNRLLVQAGRMAERDVIQAEADIARRELDVVSARGGLDAARLNLLDVLDLDTRVRFGPVEGLGTGPAGSAVDAKSALETAFAQRPDHRISLLDLRNAETDVLVARNGRLWDLSLTLGRTFTGSDDGFRGALGSLDRSGHRVTLDLSVPVGRGAAGPAQLEHRRSVAALRNARNRHEELRQRIDIEVRNAVRSVELAARRVALAGRARELAAQKTAIEREKLNLGVTTNFQLVAFENDLVLAENAELDALVDHLNAATELDRTMGTTLSRWGIEIDRVEHALDGAERFGVEGSDG